MRKSYKVLLHLLYWSYFFGWSLLARSFYKNNQPFTWADLADPLSISNYFVFLSTFYINYSIIMPRLFRHKRYKQTWLSWFLLIAYFIAIRYLVQEVLLLKWFGIHNYFKGTTLGYYTFDNIYYAASMLVMSIVFWSVENWIKNEQEKVILEREKTNAEVSFLKSQVNPHFLFNTLNNIYSLVYHNSEKSLPAILKLSELMRYMTHETNADRISLSKDIRYIESFIELQSLRATGEPAVQFTTEGDATDKQIAPLLLIPFIENGFKHGIITDRDHPFIIRLTLDNNSLHLYTRNRINKGQKDHSGGVGMENVKRRLELLYPGNYSLQIKDTGDEYICDLTIQSLSRV
ncbi:sensor histidine kinase [Sediminibacterium ginsengisoli]|uniref:Histidine kinase n=1 Tax=Sediminibacterium ginsengisoli TaxID=413434 RepID=A0A1T4L836_9BACT|nr:histidine kinase [Sediminibacterium ginsengisoli]SJZ50879.1 Histidine kinase [Sediminibacterium ginsengisoli]